MFTPTPNRLNPNQPGITLESAKLLLFLKVELSEMFLQFVTCAEFADFRSMLRNLCRMDTPCLFSMKAVSCSVTQTQLSMATSFYWLMQNEASSWLV